jgi:hypothetical protein
LSRRNALTVAFAPSPCGPEPSLVYVGANVPPGTGELVQQLSPLAPQLAVPGAGVAQLA